MCFYRFFFLTASRRGLFSSGHWGTFFFILYITLSSFSRVKRRGGMGYVCTVRQLGLLYFLCIELFN